VFKNRVRKWIFGPKRDEVTGEWRRLRNEELYAVPSSTVVIPVINKEEKIDMTINYVT
jgi:hypothetical protein